MARVGWGLGEDEGQWTFPGFLGFLHFWVRCYDTVMEGRFSRGLEANSLQVGGRSSVRKQLWAAMTGRQACPCPLGTTLLRLTMCRCGLTAPFHVLRETGNLNVVQHFPVIEKLHGKLRCSALAQHIFLPLACV